MTEHANAAVQQWECCCKKKKKKKEKNQMRELMPNLWQFISNELQQPFRLDQLSSAEQVETAG